MFALGHVVKGMLFDSTTVQIKAVKTSTALYLFLFIYLLKHKASETLYCLSHLIFTQIRVIKKKEKHLKLSALSLPLAGQTFEAPFW